MKERPILFSAPMVRAILTGQKTQTRRKIKFPLKDRDFGCEIAGNEIRQPEAHRLCPYGAPGDRLWVKETFFDTAPYRNAPLFSANAARFVFRADGAFIGCHKWKPSIFMPKLASRILLEVTAVRVERLQEISDADAIAEGVEFDRSECPFSGKETQPPVLSYRQLWNSIKGPGEWDENPWVWVVEFRRAAEPRHEVHAGFSGM